MRAALVTALLVGVGGFGGSILRFGVSGAAHRLAPLSVFPYGTLVVNLTGCLLIGVLSGLAESRQLFGSDTRAFLLMGVLGGFTTFSSFGYETFAMARDAEYLRSAANVLANVVLGLAAVWLGHSASSSV